VFWGAFESGDDILGGADPLGGGGGGVGVPLGPPNGGADGGMTKFCWCGNGDVIGAAAGVDLLGTTGFVTIGVSFQLTISLAREGGGTDGVVAALLGGPPKDGWESAGLYPIGVGIVGPYLCGCCGGR
jgi:hypothetical protein